MSANYPSNIPGPLISGFSANTPEYTRENKTLTGPPIFEFLTDVRPEEIRLSFNFSAVEFSTFEKWWNEELVKGSVSAVISLQTSSGLVSHTGYLFPYSRALRGVRWAVSTTFISITKEFPA